MKIKSYNLKTLSVCWITSVKLFIISFIPSMITVISFILLSLILVIFFITSFITQTSFFRAVTSISSGNKNSKTQCGKLQGFKQSSQYLVRSLSTYKCESFLSILHSRKNLLKTIGIIQCLSIK